MADRLRWWVIPGALVVLLRVVTLDEPASPQPAAPRAAAVLPTSAAGSVADQVVLRDASGRRSAPMVLPTQEGLLVSLPKHCAGKRVQLTVWRRTQSGREVCFVAHPTVRGDAVLPIGGQPRAAYDLEVVVDGRKLVAHGVECPCAVTLVSEH